MYKIIYMLRIMQNDFLNNFILLARLNNVLALALALAFALALALASASASASTNVKVLR